MASVTVLWGGEAARSARVHTNTPLACCFPLNDPLPEFFCLERKRINWITPSLFDQRSPCGLLSWCLSHWGIWGWGGGDSAQRKCLKTIHELQLFNNPELKFLWCVWIPNEPESRNKPRGAKKQLVFGLSWSLQRLISEGSSETEQKTK